MNKFFSTALSFLVISGCAQTREVSPSKEFPKANAVMVEDLEGVKVPLFQKKGNVTLIHFWASWCFVCPPEMEELSHLYEKVRDQGVDVIGVATSDTKEDVKSFLKKHSISFPLVVDTTGEISKEFSLESVPGTLLLDSEGNSIAFPDPQDGSFKKIVEGPRGWESQKVVRALESLSAQYSR